MIAEVIIQSNVKNLNRVFDYKIPKEYEGKVVVCKIDIDENEELANEYNIMSVPTVIIFKNNENVEEIIGLNNKSKYTRALDE